MNTTHCKQRPSSAAGTISTQASETSFPSLDLCSNRPMSMYYTKSKGTRMEWSEQACSWREIDRAIFTFLYLVHFLAILMMMIGVFYLEERGAGNVLLSRLKFPESGGGGVMVYTGISVRAPISIIQKWSLTCL
ncbi:hypothetical protein NPIL_257431 [Nephila pilipes]|uniref:Uncharacterized protein n=1 Tax=Nephila pilipes TaxID=299642 RepID=A0A8X6P513_NEPPI|nr:hypothetical protein NPIL_257431 [Nephila pilipes]